MKNNATLRNYLLFVLITFIILYIYNVISHFITQMPIVAGKHVFLFEFPIYLALVTPFYFSKIENPLYKYIVPNIFGLLLYVIFDTVYAFLARAPRLSDTKNIHTIFDFYPLAGVLLAFAAILLGFMLYLLFKNVKRYYSQKEYKKSLVLRALFFIVFLLFLQSTPFLKFNSQLFCYMPWAEKSTIKKNGRLSSFLYFSYQEQQNRKKLLKQAHNRIEIAKTLYNGKLIEKPNIYYIVLESFMNPNYLKNIQYNQNPLAKEMLPYLRDGNFTHVISPVYGGNTAQAEFELLTGISALAKIDTIEFNLFQGGVIDSFVTNLQKSGYQTFATIATDSKFFNSKVAYKSLGFQKTIFLKEQTNFHLNPNDKKIFDGDLFDYNLQIIKEHLQNHQEPFMSYVLGMYGHIPYERNKKERPDIIKLTHTQNSTITRVANQFYYRTKALAKYIKTILTLDPKSIIFISSDHIPAVLNQKVHYKYEKHTNIALLLYRGQFKELGTVHQYEVPRIIWSTLTDQQVPQISAKEMEQLYYKALFQSIKKQ